MTFALLAYNQERYIAEAVEAAFNQDYSPLELILSDDCSTDSTFDLISLLAANYCGPHRVVINRNTRNLGIGGHINAVCKLVQSQFVVVAAGDDISVPERTRILTEEWLSSKKIAKSIYSMAEDITLEGKLTRRTRAGSDISRLNDVSSHARQNLWVLGAAHAWDMDIVHRFPPLIDELTNEDVILSCRAAMIGRIHYVPFPLVKYRSGIGVSHEYNNMYKSGMSIFSRRIYRRSYLCALQKNADFSSQGIFGVFKTDLKVMKAKALLPCKLVDGKSLTTHQLAFFIKRTSLFYTLKELVRFRLPIIVRLVYFFRRLFT